MNSSSFSVSHRRVVRARTLLVGLAVFALAPSSTLFAQLTQIRGSVSATGGSTAPSLNGVGTGLISASGSAGPGIGSPVLAGAKAFGTVYADYGRLGLQLSAVAQWSKGATISTYQASADAEAVFFDTITFRNAGLALGAAINVTVSAALDASLSTVAGGGDYPTYLGTGGIAGGSVSFTFGMSTLGGTTLAFLTDSISQQVSTDRGFFSNPPVLYQSQVVTVTNGSTYYINGDLGGSVAVNAWAGGPNEKSGSGAATLDALHTALVGFDVTGGTTYTTGSSTRYVADAIVALPPPPPSPRDPSTGLSPVPEPSTYALGGVVMLSGIVALKRRKTKLENKQQGSS